MKADWTNADPAITKILKQFGRGCPTIRALSGGQVRTEPIVLPELLTKSTRSGKTRNHRAASRGCNKIMKTKLLLLTLTIVCCHRALRRRIAARSAAPRPISRCPIPRAKPSSFGDYKGKYVVLEWFNPDCPFVKKHYGSGNMQKLQEEFTGKGVVWLTIDSSAPGKEGNLTPEQANKKMAEWKMKSTALLLDPDGKVGHAYGAKNTPHMFVINPEGKVIYEGAIDSKAIAESGRHPELDELRESRAGGSDGGQTGHDTRAHAYGARSNTNKLNARLIAKCGAR